MMTPVVSPDTFFSLRKLSILVYVVFVLTLIYELGRAVWTILKLNDKQLRWRVFANILMRRTINLLFTLLCVLTAIVGVYVLGTILWTLFKFGAHGLNWQLFTETTPSPGVDGGGLSNAIIGSILLSLLGIVIATPLGILAATYLVDYSKKSTFSKLLRFVNDILLSAPSIVMGLFIYALVVRAMHRFSALAGALALAVIALPMIVRMAEDVLYLVSPTLKEAAVALGIPRWQVSLRIIYRSARQGLITAVLLALARIMGETAPLLFTALNYQFTSTNLLRPIANLPVVIFRFAMSPYKNWQDLAWAGALFITLLILAINLFARLLAARRS